MRLHYVIVSNDNFNSHPLVLLGRIIIIHNLQSIIFVLHEFRIKNAN